MKNTLFIRPLCLSAAMALAVLTAARAEEATNSVKFSDPSKPGTLKVVLARGEIQIHGADAPEVVVKSEAQPQRHPRKDGLRVLTESATYSLSEKDNVVTLDAGADGMMGAPSDFQITVPRSTNVVIANSMGGDVTCAGISGDVEIRSINSEVRLDDLVGGAIVDTKNGEIRATIHELHAGKALSFTSMNGEVILRVPADAKANVRLRTQNGTILTDFDDKALVTKVENVAGSIHRGHGAMLTPEFRDAVREAARAGAIAIQQAAVAAREAAEAAREGAEAELDKDNQGHDKAVPAIPPIPPIPAVLPSIPPVVGGKLVTGTLNGGGPEINVTTMNGDVTLRKIDGK